MSHVSSVYTTPPRSSKSSDFGFKPKLEPLGDDGACRFMEDCYDTRSQIGEGTYGQVYIAQDRSTHEEVALKKIRMDNEKDGFPITAIREIKILRTANDDNVIRLREIVRSKPRGDRSPGSKCSVYMVFDYMEHDLMGLLERLNYKLQLPQIKHFMKQLCKGLNSCHKNGILHRDLKLSNLLISKSGDLKLADFGLARPFKEVPDARMTNRVITLWYRPPELLLGSDRYGPAIDMWSVGCIFAELLTGRPIFPGKDELDQLDKIFNLLGSPTEANMPGCSKLEHYGKIPTDKYKTSRLNQYCERNNIPASAAVLLEKMLSLNPNDRPSAEESLRNDFFWNDPPPEKPPNLDTLPSSHEFTMKRKKQHDKHESKKESPPQKRQRHMSR